MTGMYEIDQLDARSTEVNLPSFLKDNVYQATIFKDAPNSYEQPKEYMVEKRTVDSKLCKYKYGKGGGFVIPFGSRKLISL